MNDFGSLTGNCLKDNDGSNEDCNTQKVRFKEVDGNLIENMVVDVASVSGASWKINCLGGSSGSLVSSMNRVWLLMEIWILKRVIS
ncbi:hypothetical protein PVK06_011315 [Gossypium arboreum]|uniref:Uncharacterized protein n=1 Tax=Gossypium arboreum TaxID=29729 RepID=A0ABR0Q8S8_GOSAR|nr:hypothetical protein PVK06_011315 [Gossypium arboreum]